MTPSTDSSVKKVICSGEERGCQPGRAAEQGANTRGRTSRGMWGRSDPPRSPPQSGGGLPPTPTTRVSGRFQETMPTSPDSASCRCTSRGVRMGRGLCQAVGPRAAPTLGQNPPSPEGPEPAPEQQGCRGSLGAASLEKLLIQGTGEPGDCGRLHAGQQTWARICATGGHRRGNPRPARVLPPPHICSRQSILTARPGSRAPCRRRSTPRTSPCLWQHRPAQGFVQTRVTSTPTLDSPPAPFQGSPSLTESPWGDPRDSPTMHHGSHRQRVGAQRGYTPLGPAANSASSERYGPDRAGLRQTPPRTAPAPDSPRSRPRTGRSAGSWRRA